MKTLITALALAALMATSAVAQTYYYPSYDCGPAEYDSSGTQVPSYCGR